MALYASGVTIPTDLSGALGGSGAGTAAYNNIGANYNKAKQQFASDAQARGMNGANAINPNSYAGNQFATKQGLDVGGLESALGGGLGNTAYQNTLQQRDFGQQEQLANEAAQLNKPDMLQQILSGISQIGKPLASIYGAWGTNAAPSSSGITGGGGGAAYNINQPGPLDLGYNYGY